MLAILANNMRERKTMLQTVDEHGLSLIWTGARTGARADFDFHFPSTNVEANLKGEDESCCCENGDAGRVCGFQQWIGGARSDRGQHIENRGRSVMKM